MHSQINDGNSTAMIVTRNKSLRFSDRGRNDCHAHKLVARIVGTRTSRELFVKQKLLFPSMQVVTVFFIIVLLVLHPHPTHPSPPPYPHPSLPPDTNTLHVFLLPLLFLLLRRYCMQPSPPSPSLPTVNKKPELLPNQEAEMASLPTSTVTRMLSMASSELRQMYMPESAVVAW